MSQLRTGPVLLACILASSLVGMDSLMTVVALPAIAEGFGVGLSVQQWIVATFLLALGSLLLVGGALGDRFGQWRVFGIGATAFGAASCVCAVAPSAPVLLVGRLAQGAAAALLLPSVLAVLTTTFSDERRSKAIATWSAWSGLSVIAGPLVGGLLIDTLSWRAIYWVEVPFAALVVVLIARAAPRGAPEMASGRIDVTGALLAVASVGGPAYFLIQGPRHGWLDTLVVGALVIGLIGFVLLVLWERRASVPLLPLEMFRVRRFTVLNVVTFVLYGALISCSTYTVLFLQDTLGYHPAAAGVVAAVPIMVLFVLSGSFGALADRFGGRLFIGGGAVVAGLGMLLLLRVDANADLVTVVLPSVLVHGLGLAMLVAPLTSGVMSAVSADRAGVASGVNNAVARTGSMIAIAGLGVLISLQFSAGVDRELGAQGLGPTLERVIERAREQPLADTPSGSLTEEERAAIEPVLADASVGAFRLGVAVSGGLALLAGVVALVGMREHAKPGYDAAGTLGCPITGARTHRDAAPIGSRTASSWDG